MAHSEGMASSGVLCMIVLNPKCMIPFLSPRSSRMAFALFTEVSSGPIHRWNSLRVLVLGGPVGYDRRNCQTVTATPAKPGELP